MENQSYSSVLIFRKLKTDDDLIGAAEHNSRWKEPPNADPKRSFENKILVGGDQSIRDLVRERIKACNISPRSNAVLALEFIQSAGRDFFKNIKPREADWVKSATAFLANQFGRENVVHVSLHKDESTTHLHAIVVPIVKANDKDGRFRKKRKHREWKLDSKGIFEKSAHERKLGVFDRSAATFCQSDFTTCFKFIKKLIAKADPVSTLLANKMNPDALASFSNRLLKLKDKRKILITEMNRILAGPSLFDEPVIAQLPLPPATLELKDRYPTGNDLYCLNRRLIEAAYKDLILKCEGRPIGNPTALYLHDLQVKYFELCQDMDPQISAPRYGAKMEHQKLSEFYAALETGLQTGFKLADIDVKPTPFLTSADKHAEEETTRINEALKPLVALAANAVTQQKELEETNEAIRQLNDKNASLTALNEALRHQMRHIPLVQVLEKLGFNQRVPGKQHQFQLPNERIIEITEPVGHHSKASFLDVTGRFGLGQMAKRKSGKGAIDLTMFLTGWDLALSQKWLQNHFQLDAVLNESADKMKDELAAELGKPATQEQSSAFALQVRLPLFPDENQWLSLRQSLTDAHQLDAPLLNDLHAQNLIAANQQGALVCIKFNKRQFVGGMALGLKPNPVTGIASVYETPDDDGYPFVIGNPQAEISAIVSSPLEALSLFQLSERKARVFATKAPLPPAIVADLKQRVADTNKPVFLAYGWSPEDDERDKKMKSQLETAGVSTAPLRPPILNDQPKSWGDMLWAVKAKCERFSGISLDSITTALEKFSQRLGISIPSTPVAPEIGQSNKPKIH
jgi:hypothetical protein